MQEGVNYYYENLLASKNTEIQRLQGIINSTPNFATVQMAYEDTLLERAKEIRRLDKELCDLNCDYDELFESNDILEEKVIRLEMDLDNAYNDITDIIDSQTYEREQAESKVKALTDMVKRQEGDIDYLEKLSSAYKETCDGIEADWNCLNVENKALKNARDGLLTWSADEIESLELEKKANEETIKQLQAKVADLQHFRDIDEELFKAMRSTWDRQRVKLEKFDALRKDGTLEYLLDECEDIEEEGYTDTAKDVRRIVQLIKEDARK